ncbi:MAG: glycogen/starch synthase [Desulfobacterales bacterium]|nr:glycogen/starch synthase [Desulfobacterales bacterium]MBF0398963.1 glycogen/starch synthase [Desulfobacterales bacterium]
MTKIPKNPRILIVTPEATYLPDRMGGLANYLTAKAGGLADVSAALISSLFKQGADVHVAIPDYRSMFSDNLTPFLRKEFDILERSMPDDRIHLVKDRAFFYLNRIYSGDGIENTKLSLTFQRDVLNYIIPNVKPDLIHCNDWMTGLIPAMSRVLGIPCLITIHNIHTVKCFVSNLEDRGIDAAAFWKYLFYKIPPYNYEESRNNNLVDFLTSGIFASHFVNTVSPQFLIEIIEGRHKFIEPSIRQEIIHKYNAGCAVGILNAPDPSFNPSIDKALFHQYGPDDYLIAKRKNKIFLQSSVGLIANYKAPLFFWPSRLDPIQKGCQLLSDILFKVISEYWNQDLQVIFVANGDFQKHFKNIVRLHGIEDRVAIYDFDENLEHLAYGASDFILMPSLFEPCGLPQMIGPIYGTLPVAHDTGGIHDTIHHLNVNQNQGNGFIFKHFDSNGLFWGIREAMSFYNLPDDVKIGQIKRIMKESLATFNHSVTAIKYIELYEKMLKRPLINDR